jgi:hypothetical protein
MFHTPSFFARRSQKRIFFDKLAVIFMHLRSVRVKAAHRTLMNLTPRRNLIIFFVLKLTKLVLSYLIEFSLQTILIEANKITVK